MTEESLRIERDRLYSRAEIHDMLGGGIQTYLPHVGGRVVAICLRKDLGAHAPREILVGEGPEIERTAHILCQQEDSTPAFLKEEGGWKYAGHYRVAHWTEEPRVLKAYSEESQRQTLTRVMFLVRAGDHALERTFM